MGLREQAEADLAFILEDSVGGDGNLITLTDPNGLVDTFTGFSNDISQVIDPDTGQAVSGRQASITLRISSLYAAGFGLPKQVSDTALKPWVVQFNDINGLPYTFKVSESMPDRALGVVVCMLETYS